jgi:hypothetical protein
VGAPEYTLTLRAVVDEKTGFPELHLSEHRKGRPGQLLTVLEVGPFGLDKAETALLTSAFDEAVNYALHALNEAMHSRMV